MLYNYGKIALKVLSTSNFLIPMEYKGKRISYSRLICLLLYKSIAIHLPVSYSCYGGKWSKKIRYILCKHIFDYCGKNVNIEHGANFGNGFGVRIGDNSGLGINCLVPNDTTIGKDVMMGPNCRILSSNHRFSSTDIPMRLQGLEQAKQTIIEDDVWIGRDVLMTTGRLIQKGTIIGMGTVLTKDFPEYSIVGGNPSKLIRLRKEK